MAVAGIAMIAPFASGSAIATYHVFGGGNSCSSLQRTERVNRAPDTLAVRFIAESKNGDCLRVSTTTTRLTVS